MSLSNGAENAILALLLNATTWNNWAENDTTSPNASIHIGGHTGDPGEAGNQETNECAYGSYARIATDRNATDWPVTDNTANLGAVESFPAATSGTETITHCSIGGSASGTGELVGSGAITPNIAVSTGVTPQLTTATAITLD